MQPESWNDIGPMLSGIEMSETVDPGIFRQSSLLSADSRASHLASLDGKLAQRTAAISGQRCIASLRSLGRDGLLEKMLLSSPISTWIPFALTWKISVTRQHRFYFQLALLGYRKSENEFSFWLTPTTSDAIRSKLPISSMVKHAEENTKKGCGPAGLVEQMAFVFGHYPTPEFIEYLMGFPAGWTQVDKIDTEFSGMPSSPKSQSLSDD